jgi:hypothetical protein
MPVGAIKGCMCASDSPETAVCLAQNWPVFFVSQHTHSSPGPPKVKTTVCEKQAGRALVVSNGACIEAIVSFSFFSTTLTLLVAPHYLHPP